MVKRVKRFYRNRVDWQRVKTAGTHVLGTGPGGVVPVDLGLVKDLRAWVLRTGLTERMGASLALASFLARQAPSKAGRPTNRAHLRFRLEV